HRFRGSSGAQGVYGIGLTRGRGPGPSPAPLPRPTTATRPISPAGFIAGFLAPSILVSSVAAAGLVVQLFVRTLGKFLFETKQLRLPLVPLPCIVEGHDHHAERRRHRELQRVDGERNRGREARADLYERAGA